MKPLPHTYDVRLAGGAEGYATLSVPGVPDLRSAPPPASLRANANLSS